MHSAYQFFHCDPEAVLGYNSDVVEATLTIGKYV